jgi:hypothetical protein
MDLKSIVVEENGVLGGQRVLEIVSLKDSVKLSEQFERIFDGSDDLEVLINVLLKLSLDS